MSPIYNPAVAFDREQYYNTATTYESIPRRAVNVGTLARQGTGRQELVGVFLPAGFTVTNIGVEWGTTGSATPTNWWFALYDTQATPALIAQTADQLTTAISASVMTTLALASPAPYLVPVTGLYYATVMVAAASQPTHCGSSIANSGLGTALTGMKRLTGGDAGPLTTTAPNTLVPTGNSTSQIYVRLT